MVQHNVVSTRRCTRSSRGQTFPENFVKRCGIYKERNEVKTMNEISSNVAFRVVWLCDSRVNAEACGDQSSVKREA